MKNDKVFNPGECPIAQDWVDYRESTDEHQLKGEIAMKKIDTIHEVIKEISNHTSHLSQLDTIARILIRAFIAQTALMTLFFGAIVLVVLMGDKGKLVLSPTSIDLEKGG